MGAGAETHFVGIGTPDPFSPPRRFWPTFINAVLATALFRCWHILLFFGAWATAISVISNSVHNLGIQSTLLTVLGTVLGFVISYRTTASFERYNEGRRYWSQIVLASRTFARTVWFHVPDTMNIGTSSMSPEEKKTRIVIEKKTVLNLLEAFGVAVKHYLRGEEGVYYEDLYHLVKYLPAYALPAGMPSNIDLHTDLPTLPNGKSQSIHHRHSDANIAGGRRSSISHSNRRPSDAGQFPRPHFSPSMSKAASAPHLPLPATSPSANKPSFVRSQLPQSINEGQHMGGRTGKESIATGDDFLFPASMPPKYGIFDLFPFSLLVKLLTKRGKEVGGKKAARLRAKLRTRAISHNLPLEISLYLSSYIGALQRRSAIDGPTVSMFMATLNQLVDALTGLERILTTPVPFSYSIHLWVVTIVYCMVLPFQLWTTMGWLTIPGTVIACFFFFGFIVAGEEIENPFGYDKNDLNMDHFTNNIIRNELRAIAATPAPDPADWAFSTSNDLVFNTHTAQAERVTPEEWVKRGPASIQAALSNA